MKNTPNFLVLLLILIGNWSQAQQSTGVLKYKVTSDVIYGQGKVRNEGKEVMMDLWMDVYEPVKTSTEPFPAVILIHGGSFHRGNPRNAFYVGGVQTTSMASYAESLASAGFVCFIIKYRLAPDNPVLSYEDYSEADLDSRSWTNQAGFNQVNLIRQGMGLEIITQENSAILKNASVAAVEDLRTALRFVKKSKVDFNVDVERIGVGGFSAGAITAINLAYALQEEIAAVFTLSGFSGIFNIEKLLSKDSKKPPIRLFMGQYDLPVVSNAIPPFLNQLKENEVDYSFYWVPGFGHFYPSGATSLSNDGLKVSVERRILEFLTSTLYHK